MENKNNTGEVIMCKCGRSSMRYMIEDIDLYSAEAYNTLIVKEGYGKACICKACKFTYDHFDPCMVKDIEHTDAITDVAASILCK